jgi:hypothetical protein
MRSTTGARWSRWLLASTGLSLASSPAVAIEFWDQRVQIHGFYETRMSFGYEDFDSKNEIDMYGWLQVLDVEAEIEIAPDGWGPFDTVAAFARVEVKYDCVWSHACGMLPSVDAFGNDPKNLPNRVQSGRREGLAGSQIIYDRRPFWFADRQRLSGDLFEDAKAGQRAAKSIVYGSTNVGFFSASAGPDGVLGDFQDIRNEAGAGSIAYGTGITNPTTLLDGDDDAGLYVFDRVSRCDVGNWTQKASSVHGYGNRELLWSIDGCRIDPIGFNRELANPFADAATSTDPVRFPAGGDVNPVLLSINRDPTSAGFGLPLDPDGIPDVTALPFRPGSEWAALPGNKLNKAAGQKNWQSQGIYVPNLAVRKKMRNGDFGTFDQNFSLNDLEWNRGASQEPLKELREIYVDFEAFQSRLWMRVGKQTIVWGKTELFRNQDQWNPVDIAIGPLASLEESRIALLAVRGIWSFYEVGPFQDVRLELVSLFDKFEPADLGRCGEPYVPRLACNKSYGLWLHGVSGAGIAGEMRPEDPWNDASGTEVGARIEFRWDRFSFALTDYYGYTDTPYVHVLFQYSRNVDPVSGRPRHTEATGPCDTGTEVEPDCLVPGMDPSPRPEDNDVIANHSINQSVFALACAGTVGLAPIVDSSACAFTVFNSPLNAGLGPFSQVFGSMLAGSATGNGRYSVLVGDLGDPKIATALALRFGSPNVLVGLNVDGGEVGGGPPGGLNNTLSPEQQALLGCGPFYQIDCDRNGIDLVNAEASVLLQSFPWFEGTGFDTSWDTFDATLPQPGTVDALIQGVGADMPATQGSGRAKFGIAAGDLSTGAVGTRHEDVDGDGVKDLVMLPGSRYDPGVVPFGESAVVDGLITTGPSPYDVAQDGTATGDLHPFTGQQFSSEMAVVSWNFLMLGTGLGASDGTASRGVLDRDQPFALGRCSYRQPQYCSLVAALAAAARNTHSSVRAGGNGEFGRRNFLWATGGDVALRYEKRNIIGLSMDFAEDATKSSWGIEFTHVNDTLTADNTSMDGLREVDEYNLTLSVDRPTFINFLNANRTFFLNSQLFVSYVQGYEKEMLRDGPWTALILLSANTGYFQDRFLVSAAGVYDFTSQSMAFLPSLQYRFTENFSLTIGAAALAGKWKGGREMGVNQLSAAPDSNLNDTIYVENGLSAVRDLDNFFLRLRYTY